MGCVHVSSYLAGWCSKAINFLTLDAKTMFRNVNPLPAI